MQRNQRRVWRCHLWPLTSTGDVVLNPKVSIGASGIVAGREDDAAHRLYLADHTGDRRGGHDAILTDDKMADLKERTQIHQGVNTHVKLHGDSFSPGRRMQSSQ